MCRKGLFGPLVYLFLSVGRPNLLYIRFIKLRTPPIIYIAKPKFDSVHQSSDTFGLFKKYSRAAAQLQPFLKPENLTKKF